MSDYQVEKLIDVPVDILTMTDIQKDLSSYFEMNKKMTLTSVNPQIILMAEKNQAVKQFIESSTHRIPDGIGLVKVSGWMKGNIKERVAGIDVMSEVLTFANTHHKRIFLYGAQPEVVKLAAEKIKLTYPHLELAGYIDGFTKKSEAEIVKEMNDTKAEIIFVAMGSPRQEEWLIRNMAKLDATVFQTIGGSLDVISGTAKRAPDIFIKMNLEWLYRSFSNPKRFNRIFQVPLFIVKSFKWEREKG